MAEPAFASETDPRGTEPRDGVLVAAVLNGDRDRFAPLVERHQASLYRHARGFGLDPDTAADMVQDALVRAYESLESCQDPDRFGYWVGRILRNRCLDYLKSASQQRRRPLPKDLEASGSDPEHSHRAGRLGRAIEEALGTLPAEQREAFLLKHAEGRSYEEIAEIADASVSAMKMRVHRAREALREHLRGSGLGAAV